MMWDRECILLHIVSVSTTHMLFTLNVSWCTNLLNEYFVIKKRLLTF